MQNIYAVPWGTNHANIPAGLASDQLLSDTLPESIIGEYFKILAEQPGGEQPDLNKRSTGGEGIVGRESVFSRQVGDSDRSTDEDLAIKATSGNSKPTSPENGMSGQPMIERVAQSLTGGDNTLPHDLGHDENTRLSFHNGRFYYKGDDFVKDDSTVWDQFSHAAEDRINRSKVAVPIETGRRLRPSHATTSNGFSRPEQEISSYEEPRLDKMVRESIPTRTSGRRYDSGYSSPGTREIPARGASPKGVARYTIAPESVIIEPSKTSKSRSTSQEVPRTLPRRASSFTPIDWKNPRIEVRSVRPTRAYDNVEYRSHPRVQKQDIRFTREIRPSDATVFASRP